MAAAAGRGCVTAAVASAPSDAADMLAARLLGVPESPAAPSAARLRAAPRVTRVRGEGAGFKACEYRAAAAGLTRVLLCRGWSTRLADGGAPCDGVVSCRGGWRVRERERGVHTGEATHCCRAACACTWAAALSTAARSLAAAAAAVATCAASCAEASAASAAFARAVSWAIVASAACSFARFAAACISAFSSSLMAALASLTFANSLLATPSSARASP
mmetsp:Transcript_1013/g.3083  ORF Transcript_1013/g.3083 Transcript_1013/m.3083 type:complete len:219 (+) Transcript_1013:1853-2509(+)